MQPMTDAERQSQQKRMAYWIESSRRDRETAKSLRNLRRFDWSLALAIQSGVTPPPTHHLNRLAELAGLKSTEEHQDWLTEITDFNIEARYDDAKLSFYRKATEEYTDLWHKRCSALFSWLESKLH